jgi:O-6-methylguanine DNA methyltransferase
VNVGAISVSWNPDGKLTHIEWTLKLLADDRPTKLPPHVRQLVEQLKHYFADGDPLGPIPWQHIEQSGWTPFQGQVYRALAEIPYGETRTYGWVASRVGRATATRAVGQALRNNPLPILIPCHRVVAVTSLGGFMGIIDPNRPEVDLKRRLLALEQDYVNPLLPFMLPGIPAPMPSGVAR